MEEEGIPKEEGIPGAWKDTSKDNEIEKNRSHLWRDDWDTNMLRILCSVED